MKQFLFSFLLLVLFSCNKVDISSVEANIADDFINKTGVEAISVSLIKDDDYLYLGTVDLADGSSANISVQFDKDNTGKYLWRIIKPSESMVQQNIKKFEAVQQKEIDKLSKELDSILKTE